MKLLRAAKKALVGETWSIPLGVALTLLLGGLLLRPALGGAWGHAGGPVLLAGVLATFLAATRRPR